ncbi:MAG: DUF4384 domain-containing protein [Sedimentisphaerales bacterium]|nr:DUF4384 domain-containing protein [Sedimentisphaerales bacterium]
MTDVVRVYPIVMKQGLFRRKKPAIEILDPLDEVKLFTCTRERCETYGINPTNREALADLRSLPLDSFVVSVRSRLPSLSLLFVKVIKDESGYEWDLGMEGSASIVDFHRFLRFCALTLVSPDLPLSGEMLESWIVHRIGGKVLDAIHQAAGEQGSVDAVRHNDVLSVQWWERQLSLWLDDCGIVTTLAKIHWDSAQAVNAETARLRQEELAAIAREQEATFKAELRQMELQAQHERQKTSIETDNRLSAMEKEQELALLEKKHKKELIEAEMQIENAQWAAKKAAKESEIAVARLDSQLDVIQQAQKGREQMERMHEKTQDTLVQAREILEKLSALDILKSLARKDQRHQSIERLVSEEFGFDPAQVALAGYTSTDSELLRRIREKVRQDPKTATIRKVGLQTRSIPSVRFTRGLATEVSTAEIQALPKHSSLQFSFQTMRAGLVTLLNIGTSGAIYVHIPNAFVSARAARAETGKLYEVPGPQFLPWDRIQSYTEEGPGGWEHIALIVSDEPLIDHGTVLRSTPKGPLVKLSQNEVDKLTEKLDAIGPDGWAGALLSFQVLD